MTPPNTGGLWARLFGLEKKAESGSAHVPPSEPALVDDPVAPTTAEAAAIPLARPVASELRESAMPALDENPPIPIARPMTFDDLPIPLARPVDASPAAEVLPERDAPLETVAEEVPSEEEAGEPWMELGENQDVAVAELAPPSAVPTQPCPACQTLCVAGQAYCHDCGWMFGPDEPVVVAPSAVAVEASPSNSMRIKDRYEIRELLCERSGIKRYRGIDHGLDGGRPVPVVIVRATIPTMTEPVLELDPPPLAEIAESTEDELLPTFDEAIPMAQVETADASSWPSIAWEQALLSQARHESLPAIVDYFVESQYEYLIEEQPEGTVLWDAWDDPDRYASVRYRWLMQIAEGLQALHKAGAIVEGLRPDLITVTASGQAMLTDLVDLLPLPVPPGTPVRANLYTAPELILTPEQADARADLYSFGALLYSLEYLHHALEEKDFERQFVPRQITDRFPDVHPGFSRLLNKTFVRDLNTRFPTDEASKEDATGFTELIRTLDVCRRTFDNVRLDIAAWTTTGMVRTGNEDAFGLLHAVESRQDELSEYAVVLLADGMGGYEAGEVAAALAIQSLRTFLLQQPMFAALAGKEVPASDAFDIEGCKKNLLAALKHANKEVHAAARTPGKGRRGMGCTAEAVYIDHRHLVVGHVGDSRTYHLHQGRLIQLTRDQTLVNRLVELGQLTAKEAEDHPRKNELQQAIGGQPDVEPGLYHGRLQRGDWVLICSDGLTNHVAADDLQKMLMRETSNSAEEAARRLLNLVNLRGATDNATLVVIRAS
jgi:serine/threonine protein phosphatase PrpC